MYHIRNQAFDEILKKYGAPDLYALSAERLEEIVSDGPFRTAPILRKNEKGQTLGIDRMATAEKLESEYTFSEYMGELFWEERHREIAQEVNILEQLTGHAHGDETFELMARYRIGVFKLKPGQEADVDWTPRWVREVYTQKPISRYCKLTEIVDETAESTPEVEEVEESTEESVAEESGGKTEQEADEVPKKQTREVVYTDDSEVTNKLLDTMGYPTLLKTAKDLGIDDRRVPADELKEKIKTVMEQNVVKSK